MKAVSFLFILVFITNVSGLCQQISYPLSADEIQLHELKKEGSRNIFSLEAGGCATFRVQGIGVSV